MHPTLFTIPKFFFIGPITVHTYGVIIAIAFLVGLWIIGRQAAKAGLDRTHVIDLGVYALIAGLLGSKMALVMVGWREHSPETRALFWVLLGLLAAAPLAVLAARRYGRAPWVVWGVAAAAACGIVAYRYEFDRQVWRELFALLQSAGVFYGGFAAALIVIPLYARHTGLPFWPTLDALAPGLALGQAIGRIGCLSAGCCYGTRCDLPWAVTFHDPWAKIHLYTPIDTPLHPTQIYESLMMSVIFLALIWIAPNKRFHGQLAVLYSLAYAAGRFGIERFRGDVARGTMLGGWLSTSQAIAIVVAVAVVALLPYLWKHQRVPTKPA
jgi:phosphatidylglycerol:prolipoprotein diacylglycerol transferase